MSLTRTKQEQERLTLEYFSGKPAQVNSDLAARILRRLIAERRVKLVEIEQGRDPRQDPQDGDCLLAPDGPRMVGGIVREIAGHTRHPLVEVMWGCGDSRYYYTPLPEWRERMKTATVLYASRNDLTQSDAQPSAPESPNKKTQTEAD